MNMKATIKVINPDAAEMTLTLTMPLVTWEKLRTQLMNDWPAWELSATIDRAVRRMREQVTIPDEAKS